MPSRFSATHVHRAHTDYFSERTYGSNKLKAEPLLCGTPANDEEKRNKKNKMENVRASTVTNESPRDTTYRIIAVISENVPIYM